MQELQVQRWAQAAVAAMLVRVRDAAAFELTVRAGDLLRTANDLRVEKAPDRRGRG